MIVRNKNGDEKVYKADLSLVIVAMLIVTSAVSTVSIVAVTTPLASAYTAPTVSITPSKVRDNTFVQFTLVVNNSSGTDNVENIIIIDQGAGFTCPLGGSENIAENWDNVADNLIAVVDNAQINFTLIRDNMLNAVMLIKAAGTALSTLGSTGYQGVAYWENEIGRLLASIADPYLQAAGTKLGGPGDVAAAYWANVALCLMTEPFDFESAADNMKLAANLENVASRHLTRFAASWSGSGGVARIKAQDNLDPYGAVGAAADNLAQAAKLLENWVAENLDNTVLGWMIENLENYAKAWENVGKDLDNYGPTGTYYDTIQVVAEYAENKLGKQLRNAVENFRRADNALDNAGYLLGLIDNFFLENARLLWARDTGPVRPQSARVDNENLLNKDVLENIRRASTDLTHSRQPVGADLGGENYDNLKGFAENLKKAANGMAITSSMPWLGSLFGSDILGYYGEPGTIVNTVRYYLYQAGDNMDNENAMNITNAANALYNVGQKLKEVGDKIKRTKALLLPTSGWGLENCGLAGEQNGLVFTPIINGAGTTENRITPGTSKTFSWLWKAPDISIEQTYTFRVYIRKQDNTLGMTQDITVTVDGKAPALYPTQVAGFYVQQTGVTENNVVGKVLDNGKITITLVANEALGYIGDVRIENVGWGNSAVQFENVLPPITLTSTDQITWTAELYTTSWLDNWENLRVRIPGPWATDNFGLENTSDAQIDNLTFDTKAPKFNDNGLQVLNRMPLRRKPGSLYSYRENTNLIIDNINGDAEDNTGLNSQGVRRGWTTTTLYVNDVLVGTATKLEDNRFTFTNITLNEGNNTVKIKATDRVGNYTENKVENIFIDNTKPNVSLVKISKMIRGERTLVDFTNGMRINDNQPKFKLSILDPGYPTTGWGIPRENLRVMLDNDTTNADGSGISLADNNLENLPGQWDNGASALNFENWCHKDNALPSGTYYLRVWVSDNVLTTKPYMSQADAFDSVRENDNYVFTFIIDTTAPTAPLSAPTTNPLYGTTMDDPKVYKTTSFTLSGRDRENGETVNVYAYPATQSAPSIPQYTVTVDSSGNWGPVMISLTRGVVTQVELSATDIAGNESIKVTWGFAMADDVAPTITITSPASGTVTDQTTILVAGSIGKDDWEEYSDLTVNIQIGSATAGDLTLGSDGSFSISAALTEGPNTITVKATDEAGNQASQVITVDRAVTPWVTYAIIIVVIIGLVLAAIAIFRKK